MKRDSWSSVLVHAPPFLLLSTLFTLASGCPALPPRRGHPVRALCALPRRGLNRLPAAKLPCLCGRQPSRRPLCVGSATWLRTRPRRLEGAAELTSASKLCDDKCLGPGTTPCGRRELGRCGCRAAASGGWHCGRTRLETSLIAAPGSSCAASGTSAHWHGMRIWLPQGFGVGQCGEHVHQQVVPAHTWQSSRAGDHASRAHTLPWIPALARARALPASRYPPTPTPTHAMPPGSGPIKWRSSLKNTIYDVLQSKSEWVETESETDWDFFWADKG